MVHGFTQAGFGTAITILISRTFGLDDIGKVLCILEIGIFIGGAIGPFLGGFIFDVNNSYTVAFLVMAGMVLARVLLLAMIRQEPTVDWR